MVRVNRNNMSLYQEAKAGLSSLVRQSAQVFVGLMVMLLLTGGNPPGFIVALSFCLGVGFVAWSEKNRLAELPNSSEIQLEEYFTNASHTLKEDLDKDRVKSQLSRDISPNKRAIIEIVRKKFEPFLSSSLSEQELNNIFQQVENAQTEKLSELAAILGLNVAEDFVNVYLGGTNLSGDNLRGANLSGANLTGANLSGANLRGANLSRANLSGVNLLRADLLGANLSGANLRADLRGANLSGANLSGADLIAADLSGADLSGADLSGADLLEAKVIDTRFGYNRGISESIKRDLIERGAIFEDSPGETANMLTRI